MANRSDATRSDTSPERAETGSPAETTAARTSGESGPSATAGATAAGERDPGRERPQELTDPEDTKLVTLARSAMSRTRAPEAACVRDQDGRTYAASAVDLPTLRLSGLEVAVAMAVSSGARGLEAALLMSGATAVSRSDLAMVRDFAGEGVPVHLVTPRGDLGETTVT